MPAGESVLRFSLCWARAEQREQPVPELLRAPVRGHLQQRVAPGAHLRVLPEGPPEPARGCHGGGWRAAGGSVERSCDLLRPWYSNETVHQLPSARRGMEPNVL